MLLRRSRSWTPVTKRPPPNEPHDEHHNTPVTDAEEGDWVNGDAGGDSNPEESHKQSSSLKQVRFPAKDALKTKPIYTEKTLLQAPSAREAAFGGPPRYDWIDIVRTTLLERMPVGSGRWSFGLPPWWRGYTKVGREKYAIIRSKRPNGCPDVTRFLHRGF